MARVGAARSGGRETALPTAPHQPRLRRSDRLARPPGAPGHFRLQRSRNRLPHHEISSRGFRPEIAPSRTHRRTLGFLLKKISDRFFGHPTSPRKAKLLTPKTSGIPHPNSIDAKNLPK